eukprot:4128255-Amphidinium_carterae.1
MELMIWGRCEPNFSDSLLLTEDPDLASRFLQMYCKSNTEMLSAVCMPKLPLHAKRSVRRSLSLLHATSPNQS